ncbi:hypothetical protein M432DRAFT_130503 [Thermoascus aurantiacus ATCC 26904]
MSSTGNHLSNIHRSTVNGVTRRLNPESLAQVRDAENHTGMGRWRQTPASEESYFFEARMQDREAHKARVERQINRVDEVMRQ